MNKVKINVGTRLGMLLRQYSLRISLAQGKVSLYDEERQARSALGKHKTSVNATISRNVWEVYGKNLSDKKAELEKAIKSCLVGYSVNERKVWVGYFIENKTPSELAKEFSVNERTIFRKIQAFKQEMSIRFQEPDASNEDMKEDYSFTSEDLALYANPNADSSYIKAVDDLMSMGFIDIDRLDFDEGFRKRIAEKEAEPCR